MHIVTFIIILPSVRSLGMQASIFGACPKLGLIGRVVAGRASGVKMGDGGKWVAD